MVDAGQSKITRPSWGGRVFILLNVVMACLFLVGCAVQYNDPDPFVWMALYGVAAVNAGFAAAKRYTYWSFVGAAAYLLYAVYLLPWGFLGESLFIRPTWHMISDRNELAREAVGLSVCAVWMLVTGGAWWQRRHRNTAP